MASNATTQQPSDFAFDALCARYSDLAAAAIRAGRDLSFWDAGLLAQDANDLGRYQDYLDYTAWYGAVGAYLPTPPDETPEAGGRSPAFDRALAAIREMEGR